MRGSKVNFGRASADLQHSDFSRKTVFLLDTIIELLLKRSGDISESGLEHSQIQRALYCCLFDFIYGNRSRTTLKVLFFKDIQMFFSNFSWFYGSPELIRRLSSRQGGISGLVNFGLEGKGIV